MTSLISIGEWPADPTLFFTKLWDWQSSMMCCCRGCHIQDDQHKEAELGELKSLMSDDYFRVGLPEWRRRLSSEVCHFESSEGTMPLTAGELGYGSLGIILRLLCFSASLHVSGLIRVRILVVELHSAKKVTFKPKKTCHLICVPLKIIQN